MLDGRFALALPHHAASVATKGDKALAAPHAWHVALADVPHQAEGCAVSTRGGSILQQVAGADGVRMLPHCSVLASAGSCEPTALPSLPYKPLLFLPLMTNVSVGCWLLKKVKPITLAPKTCSRKPKTHLAGSP